VQALIVRRSQRNIRQLQVSDVLRFHFLDAALDLAHAAKIVIEPGAIGPIETATQVSGVIGHDVEQARRASPNQIAFGGLVALAKQSLEKLAWIALHWQRDRRCTER